MSIKTCQTVVRSIDIRQLLLGSCPSVSEDWSNNMRSPFMSSSKSLPETRSLSDDDLPSFGWSYVSETCSLVSSRMSSNQTTDDLPGPGRIIDKYIYQPGGRFLERKLNPLIHGRYRMSEIYLARKSVDNFFGSVASQSSGYFLLKHGYWDIDGFKVIKLHLSGLLYFWGGQNITGWDDSIISEQCRIITASIRSRRRHVKLEASRTAAILLNKYPRLWRYFNVSAIGQELLDGGSCSEFDRTNGFYMSLYHLSTKLPEHKLSRTESLSTRLALFSFIAGVLEEYSSEIESHVELQYFIRQLLYINGVYILYDLKLNSEFSEVIFWEKYTRLLNEDPESWKQDNVDVKLTLFTCLHMCLKGNVETMHPAFYIDEEIKREMARSPTNLSDGRPLRIARDRPLDTEEDVKRRVATCQQFVRLHFEVFLRQSSLSSSGKRTQDDACLTSDQVATTLKSRVKDRLRQVLNNGQIEDIWDKCVERLRNRAQEDGTVNCSMLTEGLLVYTSRLQDLLAAASL